MSKNKNSAAAPAEQKTEKVLTKYDQKMQKRKEAEEKAKKEAKRSKFIAVAIAALLVLFVASFPIRTYFALHTAYIKVGGEDVNRAEFDYYYNLTKGNYIESRGSYLSMLGMDSTTIESAEIGDGLTYKDYFEQLAVSSMIQTKGFNAAADAEGFEYDTEEKYQAVLAEWEAAAESVGVSLKDYIRVSFGSLATVDRLEDTMKAIIRANAYYTEKEANVEVSEDAINAYYEENRKTYDLIDYHLTVVNAELPTTAPDGTVPTDENGNAVAYEPTEEEIAEAMAKAKTEAEAVEVSIATEGTEYKDADARSINDLLEDFLFDAARKAGDTTVVEDTSRNRYLVVSFDGRRRDEENTADARFIMTVIDTEKSPEDILEEWKAGEATEESFIKLVEQYDQSGLEGGLMEGLTRDNVDDVLGAWLMDTDRVKGDTLAYTSEEEQTSYVLYYVGANDPEWKLEIRDALAAENVAAYLEEWTEGYEVEDPKGNLNYLEVEASLEAEYTASLEAASAEAE